MVKYCKCIKLNGMSKHKEQDDIIQQATNKVITQLEKLFISIEYEGGLYIAVDN